MDAELFARVGADNATQIDEGSHYKREAGRRAGHQCEECPEGYGGQSKACHTQLLVLTGRFGRCPY